MFDHKEIKLLISDLLSRLFLPFSHPENTPFSLDLTKVFLIKYNVGVFLELRPFTEHYFQPAFSPISSGKSAADIFA